MRHIEVTADDDRLVFIQPAEIAAESRLPFQPVGDARQAVLRIGSIDRDEIERGKFEGNDPPFLIVLRDT